MNTRRPPYRLALLGLSVLFAGHAQAAWFDFLEHDSLIGHVTFDAYLGNEDDQVFDGLNTWGAASQFVNSNGTYGFLGGYMYTEGLSQFGFSGQQVFGINRHDILEMWGEWNLNAPPMFNNWFTQSLHSSSSSTITINEDQTYTTSFVLDDFSPISGRIQFTGSGRYLLNGQSASALYSGDLLTHFNFVTPLLPAEWVGVAHETQTYEVLDGPYAGLTGYNTMTFYSMDPQAVPVPAVPVGDLAPPWIATGPATISEDGSSIAIGDIAYGSGADATAVLSGGSTATVRTLVIGGSGNQAMTIDGPGTRLSATNIVATGSSDISVLNGAVIASELVYTEAGFRVSGHGSELELGCADAECAGVAIFATLGEGDAIVQDGGRITARGFGNGPAGLAVFGGRFAVEGAGSTVTIIGTQSADSSGFLQTGIFVEGSATLSVTDGGRVEVTAANLGFSGVAVGSSSVSPSAEDQFARIIVDGIGSVVDAGPLFSLGSLITYHDPVTFEPVSPPIVDGAGISSEAVVSNGGLIKADRILVGPSGIVSGSGGTLEGAVENRGTLSPGLSPGVLHIMGDFQQTSDGVLIIEIAGANPGMFDVLNVSGTAILSGTLRIELVDGFVPASEDVFDFLIANHFVGGFDHFVLPTFGNGNTFALNMGPNGFSASVSAVPIPGALWLMGPAVVSLAAARRRRSSARTRGANGGYRNCEV